MTFKWTPPALARLTVLPTHRYTLYYYDGPKMVLGQDDRERQVLGVLDDEDDELQTFRWLYAPAPPGRMLELLRGKPALRELFLSGMVDVYDVERNGTAKVWSIDSSDVPLDLLPDEDGGEVDHPAIDGLFDRFDGARYQLRSKLRH